MKYWFQAHDGTIRGPYEGQNPAAAFEAMGADLGRKKCGVLHDWDILDQEPGEDDVRDVQDAAAAAGPDQDRDEL
ncbi:MAG: hypothetical protein HQL82_02375 [Magnetococcales bacterium]|nr:hypothetical protein [Magnetococcales bacterium]